MIVLVVTYLHAYTIRRYLKTWGASLTSRVTILYYEDIFCRRALPRGAYIFTDLERLSSLQLRQSETLADYLVAQGLLVLNRPLKVLRRYEFLRLLYTQGINSFRAFRLHELEDSLRFPVFLRQEHEHNGPLSPLLQNWHELESAIENARDGGITQNNLLVVEYCDITDSDGLYRKYSAFLIADRFIPRHVLFSKDWVTKNPEIVDEAVVREERHYLFDVPHPHEKQIRAVFQYAGIDYGRIDYACVNGRLEVWEINTNPTIATPESRTHPLRVDTFQEIADRLRDAFEQLAGRPASLPGTALPITPGLRAELSIKEREAWVLPLRRASRPMQFWLRKKQARLLRRLAGQTGNIHKKKV